MVWDLPEEEVKSLVAESRGIPYSDERYPSEKQLRFELCVAHHLFAHYKMDELVWNHLSVRLGPASKDYLITSFPHMFEQITPQNLSVSSDNFTGMVIHTALYDKRPDVKAICHLHSPAVLAVSCLRQGMQFFSQESASFYGRVAYHNWEGMSDNISEQERLGKDLGPTAHTLIMRNHGAVTVGSSIGEAFVRMWYLEKACRTQLTVMQSGGDICRPPADVLAHTAKQFENIPNPSGYSEWNALVKWFMSRSSGVRGAAQSSLTPGASTFWSEPVSTALPAKTMDCALEPPLYPVVVRGRKYLVGAAGSAGGALFPSYIPQSTPDFPLAFNMCSAEHSSSTESINALGSYIRQQLESELPAVGALMFKKLPNVRNADDFSALMKAIGYTSFDYSGGTSSREKKAEGVLTASSDPPSVSLEPHLEMAYNEQFPRKVFFFCHTAPLPGEGGETPVVDMQQFHVALPSPLVDKLRAVGIKYSRRLPSASVASSDGIYTWQALFFSEDRSEVEARCKELGYDFSWENDGALTWSYVRPAFVQHTPGGPECWFNQATCLHHSFYNEYPGGAVDRPNDVTLPASMQPHDTCYGDGTPFSPEDVQFMRARLWERASAVTWSTGDLLVMDNTRVAHGRMGFSSSSKRSILVSLSGD